jgi:hypothetical protein
MLVCAHERAVAEILAAPLGPRRLRSTPRVIKRKVSKWGVKRPEHRNWPQPTKRADQAVVIIRA